MGIRLGDAGEDLAVRSLMERGYRIVERNYRCALGEIDCVALDGRTLVFVEIKTRRSDACGGPFEAVDARKQRRMTRLARHYAAARGLQDAAQRFDVVAVWMDGGRPRLEVCRNAFDATD